MKSFAGGLTKAEGEWRLDVDFESAGQITRLYMGNTLLTDKLGMSVEEFTQRKRAGKKDAAKKAELAEVCAIFWNPFTYILTPERPRFAALCCGTESISNGLNESNAVLAPGWRRRHCRGDAD